MRKRIAKTFGAQMIIGVILVILIVRHWNDQGLAWLPVYVVALIVDVASPFLKNLFSGANSLSIQDETKSEALKIWEQEQR